MSNYNIRLKTPVSYYGGKQKLASMIVPLIPRHNLYCEPFIGGAAVFFAKRPSEIEVINDTNKELMNFYRTVKNDFVSLEREIRIVYIAGIFTARPMLSIIIQTCFQN